MKKVLSLFMSILIFSCCITTALATSTSTQYNVLPDDSLVVPDGGSQIMPLGIPGTGVAPQITKIELYDYGWLENGNFGVMLKVTGYGNDRNAAFFNGQSISSERKDYFINYGTTADGWYYLYDCGPITACGTYLFETTFTSTNSPYTKVPFQTTFTFELNT